MDRELLLDASGGIGVTERMAYILKVRQLAVAIAKKWTGVEDERPTARHEDQKDHKDHKGDRNQKDPS
jgi:glycyl-tRNA synthetase alpha subunit